MADHAVENLAGLATAVLRRRRALRFSQDQVAERGGPSVGTVNAIEQGKRGSYRARTYEELDRVLRWQPGTAAGLASGEITDPYARELPPEDVVVAEQPSAGSLAGYSPLGHVPHHDPALPDLSGGAEQVRAQLYHLAQQVQLLGAVVTQTRRLVDEQEPDDVPEDARRALGALDYVCHTAQVPLFLAATSAENEALADVEN